MFTAVELLHGHESQDVRQRASDVIERQLSQLQRLVDDLLDTTRVAQGRLELRPERVDLRDILHDTLSVVRPLLAERRVALDTILPSEPIWLNADPARLRQVFSNLLANAAKYTPEGGHVSLTVASAPDEVEIAVRDTGQGIAPELLPQIFDLFARADEEHAGLGIGLALARGLVEGHGGKIEARSEGPGKGSEFIVRLPRSPAQGTER
jgi:signal transduction histidine kinase